MSIGNIYYFAITQDITDFGNFEDDEDVEDDRRVHGPLLAPPIAVERPASVAARIVAELPQHRHVPLCSDPVVVRNVALRSLHRVKPLVRREHVQEDDRNLEHGVHHHEHPHAR